MYYKTIHLIQAPLKLKINIECSIIIIVSIRFENLEKKWKTNKKTSDKINVFLTKSSGRRRRRLLGVSLGAVLDADDDIVWRETTNRGNYGLSPRSDAPTARPMAGLGRERGEIDNGWSLNLRTVRARDGQAECGVCGTRVPKWLVREWRLSERLDGNESTAAGRRPYKGCVDPIAALPVLWWRGE